MERLLEEIKTCAVCASELQHEPRPVVSVSANSSILVIGQAPGAKVHASGKPWDDASGRALRKWLGVDEGQFYDTDLFGLMPMGFCYPGKGKSGDLPPRPECAPLWHERIRKLTTDVQLTLLIGQYAQKYYLRNSLNLTETVRAFESCLPDYFPLPHPSPRNGFWLRRNPWFEASVLPALREKVKAILS